ncbi:MAG: 30S ribosome-binding factor RbfA [Thermodesulfobacteriota bacterium]|nr:30S ribosome-binding factor RbfA [Thermodesulfobacteriota bacterium]
MKPYPRSERIGVKIQTTLSDLLNKKIQDPRLEMATISSVKLTKDLRTAYVYFSVFENKTSIEEVIQGFKSSHGFIKKCMAPELGLKFMPELKFVHDKSFDHGSKIDALLRGVSKPDELQ